jgi:flagella basal body P-ring formation protein FlgA
VRLKSGAVVLGIVCVFGETPCVVQVPVLNRPVSGSDAGIRQADLVFRTMSVEQVPNDAILDVAQLIGKIANRQVIPPNQPIRPEDIQLPYAIRKGDLVQVCYRSQCLMISTVAKALSAATIGESLTLERIPSNSKESKDRHTTPTLITAVAVGPRQAEIHHDRA